MKNETALQIILRLLSSHDKLNKECPEVIEVIESYLETERLQISKAWHDGSVLSLNGYILENYSDSKGYFEQNYKVNNEV